MKASEVLRRYAAGERNFQRVNLRGQSFKGKDLSGADFSEADIRSTNFTGANLRGANFTGAKCGLQKRWATLLVILSWLLAGISGLLLGVIGGFVSLIFDSSSTESQILGWVSLIVLVVFLFLIIRQGLSAVGNAVVIATVIAVGNVVGITVGSAVVITVGITVVIATVIAVVIAVEIAVVIAVEIAVVIAVGNAVVIAVVIAVGSVGVYIGWRAMRGDERDAWVRSFAIAFAAIGGTSFRSADLTEANFTGAKLKSTDLRKATLTRVRWYEAKMLDRVRPGDTYLKNTQVRQWLIKDGKDKNFDGQKLQGINLQEANLTDASFIDANLSEANLQGANLSRAKLVQTQLDGTDFTGATLTGAFIEDWGITLSTKLKGVKCEYVFMRLPTRENPNPLRKPDNEKDKFEGDDFADFIKPIFDTLDLYHNQGVDPRAIAISWKQLAENNPDANLQFASMEVKGEDNLLLRLKTAPNADKSRLNAEYFSNYNQYKGLSESELRERLIAQKVRVEEKEKTIKEINNVTSMFCTALNRSSFYVENYTNQGDTNMAGEQRNIKSETYYEQSGKFGIGHMSGGEIKGNAKVAAEINEAQKQNLADAATDIQQLLENLSENYPTSTNKEKMVVVGEAVDQIENNPTLKAKVINALKAGGTEAFKEAVNHPLVNILIATIEGWQDAE